MARTLDFAALMAPSTGPYQWWFGQTAAELGQKQQRAKMQLQSLSAHVDVDDSVKFNAVMAPGTEAWWWYTDLTGDDVGAKLTQHNARLLDLSPYIAPDGTLRFAVIMVASPITHGGGGARRPIGLARCYRRTTGCLPGSGHISIRDHSAMPS